MRTIPITTPESPETPPREKPKKPTGRVVKGNGSLYAALLQAQKDVKDVEKDATNTYHKYAYVSAEAIIKEARRVLLPQGLIALRPRWWLETNGHKLGDGCFMLVFVCEIRHPASGEVKSDEIVFPAIVSQGRPLDKAIAAALTSGFAYWLRDQLQIPRVDASMDNRDDSQYEPAKVIDKAAHVAASVMDDAVKTLRRPNRTAPLPEADRMKKLSGEGKSLGQVTSEYWALKRQAEKAKGTAAEDLRERMKALMPHPEAKTRRGQLGWEYYLPGSREETAEVSVGSMFEEIPEDQIPF